MDPVIQKSNQFSAFKTLEPKPSTQKINELPNQNQLTIGDLLKRLKEEALYHHHILDSNKNKKIN